MSSASTAHVSSVASAPAQPRIASACSVTSSRMRSSAMKPVLTTSAMPATRSHRSRDSRAARSHSTPAGGWNAPTRFLPSAVLMPVLPPTAASTIASRVVGTCTTLMPRSHVAATKPGEVRRRAAADRHDRVGPREVRLPEDLPAERRHLGGLLLLRVRQLDRERLVALRDEVLADRLARAGQRRRVHDEHAAHVPAEQPGQLAEQVPADDDVVGLVAGHGDADGHAGISLRIAAATSSAVTPSDVTCTVASRS